MNSPAERGISRRSGFTLIEMMIVLAILGLALALVGSLQRSRGLDSRVAAAALAGGLREARARAILTNRPVDFVLDLAAHRWRIGGDPPRQMPPSLAITLLTTAGEVRNEALGAIRFEPDGSSTGGRIDLSDRGRQWSVTVNWLTGQVGLHDGA